MDVWSREGRARAFQEGVLTSVSQVVWGALCSLREPVKLQLMTTHRWLVPRLQPVLPRSPEACPLCELPVLREGALPPRPHLPSLLVSHKVPSPLTQPLPCPLHGENLEQQGRENWPDVQV